MKKLTIAALAATIVVTPAHAQSYGTSDTDTTTITATVPVTCTVDAPAGGAISSVAGTETPIGNSAARCNDPDGFTLTISSANAGKLKGSLSSHTSVIPYKLLIAEQGPAVSLVNPVTIVEGDVIAAEAGYIRATSIVVQEPVGPKYADSYSDTITYKIVPN